jgi:NAD+ diphosphatase
MIHEVAPRKLNNAYMKRKAKSEDLFLSYLGDTVLVKEGMDKLWYPSFSDFAPEYPELRDNAQYLFAVDDVNFYLVEEKGLDSVAGWAYVPATRFRACHWRSFAGAVGWQLNRWYDNHRFCSRCGKEMQRSTKERMLYCQSCGFEVYPTIAPCVIVAVYHQDHLLLTKYKGRAYNRYALIAGFSEVGESLEQTVCREVREEVGLRVKNLYYYKSQPWPFTDTILAGFFAELDGDDTIKLQEDELSLGVWMNREDIPPQAEKVSLTSEMIEAFRTGAMSFVNSLRIKG